MSEAKYGTNEYYDELLRLSDIKVRRGQSARGYDAIDTPNSYRETFALPPGMNAEQIFHVVQLIDACYENALERGREEMREEFRRLLNVPRCE